MDKIQQNLDNIEKYLNVAGLENAKMNQGIKSACPKLRGYLQNISKECSEARKHSLDKSKTMVQTSQTKGKGKAASPVAQVNPTQLPVESTVETSFVMGNSSFPPVQKKVARGRPAGRPKKQPEQSKVIM